MIVSIIVFAVVLFLGSRGLWERKLAIPIIAAAFLICILSVTQSLAGEGSSIGFINKSEAGEGSRSVELTAKADGEDPVSVSITVPEMSYTDDEAEKVLDELLGEMDSLILGENEAFDNIRHDMKLSSSYEGYDAAVQWRSSSISSLSVDGTIGNSVPEKGSRVTLTAVLTLGECERTYVRELTVFPSEDQSMASRLKNAAAVLNEDSEKETYLLPDSVDGKSVRWYEVTGTDWQNLSVALLVFAIVLVFLKREQEKEKKKKRLEMLERAYPELLSRLLLLLHAGLTCRKAFTYLDEDSRKNKRSGEDAPALVEVSAAVQDMSKGVSEGEAYRRFAERCVLPCYKNLAVLLDQNLNKGGAGLVNLLEQETVIAFEDRKRQARIQGEQTSIKLLFPMIMMLGVVMIIMIVPAFMSF